MEGEDKMAFVFKNSLSVDVTTDWFNKLDSDMRDDYDYLKGQFIEYFVKPVSLQSQANCTTLEFRGLMNQLQVSTRRSRIF